MQDPALFPLLSALSAVFAVEPREEASRTARHLIEMGPLHLGDTQRPCPAETMMRAALAASDHPAAKAVLDGFHLLPWGENPVAAQSAEVSSTFIVCTLIGPDGPVPNDDLRMGLYWQHPETYYCLHAHNADETYAIIAGGAEWTAGDDTRWRGPGEMIHHPSLLPHAFRAGPQGLLALWRWSGDISIDSYHLLPDPKAQTAA
jgi:hypothetical protein